MKQFIFIGLLFILTACSSGGGGGSGSSTSSPDKNVTFPGIGTGGGTISSGHLDGTWLNGCAGGAAGPNWSYRDTMAISGDKITITSKRYINNQACAGAHDALSIMTFDFSLSNYDTMGIGDFTLLNGETKLKALTQQGLEKLNSTSQGNNCSTGSFTLNTEQICTSGFQISFKYLISDNFISFSSEGMHDGQNGFDYFTGNFYRQLSSPSIYDGSWAVSTEGGFYKLLISGEHFMFIESYAGVGDSGFSNWDGEAIKIRSGKIAVDSTLISGINAYPITLTINSAILQTRSSAATTEYNTYQVCGISDYQLGVAKNLLTAPRCNEANYQGNIRKLGETLSIFFQSQSHSTTENYDLTNPWHI